MVKNELKFFLNVFEYLVWVSHEIKKVGGMSAKPAPKKGKIITTETLYLFTNAYKNDNFSRSEPEKKDYVSVSKGVHKQKLALVQVFVTCKNYIPISKKNTQMQIVVLKVLCLEIQMVWSGWLKNDSLCWRFVALIKSRCNELGLDIQRPDQISFILL